MFKNYLRIALRNLLKQRGYTFINITGLAIGLACCLLILLYVQNELSYDRFHTRSDRIYRLLYAKYAEAPAPLAALLQDNFAEIEQTVRIVQGPRHPVRYGEKNFYEERFLLADASFFEVFDFKLVQGNVATALTEPFSLLLTEGMAAKYFGEDDPVGKKLLVNNTHEYVITGILENPPASSHIRFDFLASYVTLASSIYNTSQYKNDSGPDLEWRRYVATYLLLKPGHKAEQFEKKLAAFAEARLKGRLKNGASLRLQTLTNIHLFSHGLTGEIQPQGDSRSVYLISSIGLLILLIACINYMNLATARSASRALEVGVRKVVGAKRGQLIRQFLGESALFCVLALSLALVLAEMLLPAFNDFMGVQLDLSSLWNGRLLLILPGFVLLVALVAGGYPAFFLSSFRPARVLKGNANLQARRFVRQGLVFFQFSVTVILIGCTLVVQRQLDFIQSKPLGFEKEHVVLISTWLSDKKQNVALKHALLRQATILHVTLGSSIPGKSLGYRSLTSENVPDLPADQRISVESYGMDHDFIEALGLKIIVGRGFDPKLDQPERAVILNEAAVQALGWQKPLGKRIDFYNKPAEVIGVVKNFHSKSLREQVEPAIITLPRLEGRFDFYMAIRIQPDVFKEALDAIKTTWKDFNPHIPLQYSFLDEDIESLYLKETRLEKIFQTFTVLAVLIACMGLWGLAAFAAERRTKEIGIRKVFGATVANVVALLSKDFIKLVLLANIIAWPLSWYAMNRWLENFAYRIEIGWWIFVLAGGLALVIALVTVSTQAIKAALANPVESLRYE